MTGVADELQQVLFSGMVRGLPNGFERVKHTLQFFDGEFVSMLGVISMTGVPHEEVLAAFVSFHEREVATMEGSGLDAKCRWDGEPGGEAP